MKNGVSGSRLFFKPNHNSHKRERPLILIIHRASDPETMMQFPWTLPGRAQGQVPRTGPHGNEDVAVGHDPVLIADAPVA